MTHTDTATAPVAQAAAPTTSTPAKAGGRKPRGNGKKRGGAKPEPQSAALAPFNRMDFPANAIPESNASPQVRQVHATMDRSHVVTDVVPGLALLTPNDVAVTLPELGNFPLAVSKSGQITGIMNIGDYCRMVTGRAWNETQQANILKNEGLKIPVLPNKTEEDKALRKKLSKELDGKRTQYHMTVKPLLVAMASRSDTTVKALKLRRTRGGGIAFNANGVIAAPVTSETEQMRKKLAAYEREIKALKSVVPDETVKRLEEQAKIGDTAIDVSATVTQSAAAAPEVPVAASLIESTSKATHVRKAPEGSAKAK